MARRNITLPAEDSAVQAVPTNSLVVNKPWKQRLVMHLMVIGPAS
jgi:hypothetical protein